MYFLSSFRRSLFMKGVGPVGHLTCLVPHKDNRAHYLLLFDPPHSHSLAAPELCLQTSDERRGTSEDDWGRQIGINFWSWKSLVQSCSWKGLFSLEKSKPSWAHFFQNITLNITRIDQATMTNTHDDIVETLPRPKRPLSAYNMFFGMCFVLFECVTIKHRV